MNKKQEIKKEVMDSLSGHLALAKVTYENYLETGSLVSFTRSFTEKSEAPVLLLLAAVQRIEGVSPMSVEQILPLIVGWIEAYKELTSIPTLFMGGKKLNESAIAESFEMAETFDRFMAGQISWEIYSHDTFLAVKNLPDWRTLSPETSGFVEQLGKEFPSFFKGVLLHREVIVDFIICIMQMMKNKEKNKSAS